MSPTARWASTAKARDLLVQSVEVARSIDNRQRQATSLTNLALLEIDTGRPEAALTLLAEAERLDLELGNAWGVAADQVNRAGALLAADRLDEAAALLGSLARFCRRPRRPRPDPRRG